MSTICVCVRVCVCTHIHVRGHLQVSLPSTLLRQGLFVVCCCTVPTKLAGLWASVDSHCTSSEITNTIIFSFIWVLWVWTYVLMFVWQLLSHHNLCSSINLVLPIVDGIQKGIQLPDWKGSRKRTSNHCLLVQNHGQQPSKANSQWQNSNNIFQCVIYSALHHPKWILITSGHFF